MLPIHFTLLKKILECGGYNVVLLDSTDQRLINEGLQSVHNDMCYPALLVIGQLMDALKSGKYDIDKVALIITQTGGGCRASNYISLLRKALIRNGLGHVPVISLNTANLEKNPGFKITVPFLAKSLLAIAAADLLMLMANQTKIYEKNPGDTDKLTDIWIKRIEKILEKNPIAVLNKRKSIFEEIAKDFANIPTDRTEKVKVGIVGEIYVKFAPLGNNNLEGFLRSEDVEVTVPGLLGFLFYASSNGVSDYEVYGKGIFRAFEMHVVSNIISSMQDRIISAVKKYPEYTPPANFWHLRTLSQPYVGKGNKMGEGWLLTAEMVELIQSGVKNIICTQPFGCLPNHIVGKGMIRGIKRDYEDANIVAIDYDPGATRINQENRIKLMLSTARNNLKNDKK